MQIWPHSLWPSPFIFPHGEQKSPSSVATSASPSPAHTATLGPPWLQATPPSPAWLPAGHPGVLSLQATPSVMLILMGKWQFLLNPHQVRVGFTLSFICMNLSFSPHSLGLPTPSLSLPVPPLFWTPRSSGVWLTNTQCHASRPPSPLPSTSAPFLGLHVLLLPGRNLIPQYLKL